jgi:DNA helicase-2/ATP-dependent DNA helicase PcrA
VDGDAGVPDPWRTSAEFTIDEALLADLVLLERVVNDLHGRWVRREPVVLRTVVDDQVLAAPEVCSEAPWQLGPRHTFLRERLHFLTWANSYDARRDELIWWWSTKAARFGADPGGRCDVILPGGREAWIDGGPRDGCQVEGDLVVHSETVAVGRLDIEPGFESFHDWLPALAGDQRTAVAHRSGAARVIAPAGSGKTRTLTARFAHLLEDRGIQPGLVTAVAYNARAAAELAERAGPAAGGSVRTIHSLGRGVLLDGVPGRRLVSERESRRLLEPLVPAARRPNTDIVGPYLDALSEVRIGLRPPDEVELARDDVPGFAEVFVRYRTLLAERGEHDFDEQIYGAIERLVAEPDLRRSWQLRCRHLLVDEFQDLTPAYLLLIRLLASPALQVFGVGDDDQVIYGYAGADPGFLIDYDSLFPGAGHHALEINYRCPVAVVEAASTLLSYNHRRIDKAMRPAPGAATGPSAIEVRTPTNATSAGDVAAVVAGWIADGLSRHEIVVLCRVNSALLPVHAALAEAGIGVRSPIGPAVLDRTVLSAALAWMRIGLNPDDIRRSDLMSAIRRPSRGLAGLANEMVGRRSRLDLVRLRSVARALDARQRDRWESFCDDVELAVTVCESGDAGVVIRTLSNDIGLDRAAAALDAGRTKADRSAQSDDLRALSRLAAIHPAVADFEQWLRNIVGRPDDDDGVLLSTIHRVKGLEWRRVIVYGLDSGLLPHDLADDVEEERRIFGVAITRCREQVVVVGDHDRPSPFLAELTGEAPHSAPTPQRRRPASGVRVIVGDELTVTGGFTGVVERMLPIGVLVALIQGPGRLTVKWGEQVKRGGASGPLQPGGVSADPALVERLRAWRTATASRQRVPAYVVMSDATLEELATRRPQSEAELASVKGIGPAKIEAYGDDLLALVM